MTSICVSCLGAAKRGAASWQGNLITDVFLTEVFNIRVFGPITALIWSFLNLSTPIIHLPPSRARSSISFLFFFSSPSLISFPTHFTFLSIQISLDGVHQFFMSSHFQSWSACWEYYLGIIKIIHQCRTSESLAPTTGNWKSYFLQKKKYDPWWWM